MVGGRDKEIGGGGGGGAVWVYVLGDRGPVTEDKGGGEDGGVTE